MPRVGITFQSPPSELLVLEAPYLEMLDEATPMPQGELFSIVATDSAEYQRVVEKLTALQVWVMNESARIQASVTETPR